MLPLELRRVILFTGNLPEMTGFYRDQLGLRVIGEEAGWVDFETGACGLALHAGRSGVGQRPPKIVFHSADVAATRAALVNRGVKTLGPVKSTGSFDMCDGKDPDGNRFQISSRR